MSFLYPIFFAGLAAVGVPIVLHMIRRRTQKQQLFSSLMFLRESRPRFQSRSKIEHWLLLALRCLILGLLAWGFARPFLAKPIERVESGSVSRKVILLDTSASMRREGIWQEAMKRVASVLDDIKIEDRLCILRFDGEVRSVLNFEQWEALEPTQRAYLAAEQIQSLAPSWQPTYLDAGLMGAVKALEEDEIHTQRESVASKEIVLISDLQQGARLDLLHTFQWPEDVTLEVESVTAEKKTNATLNLLANKKLFSRSEETSPPRVRVHNSADADQNNFVLEWNEPAADSKTGRMDVYVAPGQSVVVELPTEAARLQGVALSGDDHAFDNRHFVSAPERRELNILFVGDEKLAEPRTLSFYLEKAFQETCAFTPVIQIHSPAKSLAKADLERVGFVILADMPTAKTLDTLGGYLQEGKSILVVMKDASLAEAISKLTGESLRASEQAAAKDYAMLSELDLDHPVLQPFDDPRYGDFTAIHFWKYRRLVVKDNPNAHVLARFDSGDPAWLTLKAGKGQLIVLTSGWHPADSQLALSTKFVPLLYSILEFGGAIPKTQFQYFVGERIGLTSWFGAEATEVQVEHPDKTRSTLKLDEQGYLQPEAPGMYTVQSDTQTLRFAVNVSGRESHTARMEAEELENFRIRFASQPAPVTTEAALKRQQQANFTLLESQQKLWRWILLATFVVVLCEVWLSGRLSRGRAKYDNK